jgi:6-phosphofructokinase 2
VLAIVLAGGLPGHFLEELLEQEGVPCRVVRIAGNTRISYTVNDRSCQQEFRFVAEGPEVSEAEWRAALDAVEATPADWIVASGSLARGVPPDFYVRVAEIAARTGRNLALDTSGAPLRAALNHGLALVKPSLGEFESLVGHRLRRDDELGQSALAMVRAGAAERIAVTRGRDGALLANRQGVCRLPPIEVEARSAVGAGDSFTGAMVLALARGATDEDAFAWGMAAGAAAVMHVGTAHPARGDVERLHASLQGS